MKDRFICPLGNPRIVQPSVVVVADARVAELGERADIGVDGVVSLIPLRPAERREVSDELDVCERLALGHGFVSGADLRCETVVGGTTP
jgi:hypothetical protein